MAFKDLRGFLRRLEEDGELTRVTVEVDPILEIAEITDRVSKSPSGAKALFFEKVRGSDFPVVTNIFGSRKRVCAALGVNTLDELSRRLKGLLAGGNGGVEERFMALAGMTEFTKFSPRQVPDGPCREIIENRPDLGKYPILRNFAGDGGPGREGRFITLPLVITCDPETGVANCGMYRVEILGSDSVCIHWRESSGASGHFRKYRQRAERMPVAIALGGDPVAIYAACAPLPETIDEMTFAGFLRNEPVSLSPCMTVPHSVPAGAEMVIEGFIEPGDTCLGGVFGNHSGFYDPPREAPIMRVTCITRREGMIYPATVVGRPPMEDCHLAKVNERLLLAMIRLELPEVVEINMPFEGIFHGCAIVAVEKAGPGHPREVIGSIWKKGRLGTARLLVVVDADTDVNDLSLVAWKLFNQVDWRRDLVVESVEQGNIPMGRIGIDATGKDSDSGIKGVSPGVDRGGLIRELVDRRWREYGF